MKRLAVALLALSLTGAACGSTPMSRNQIHVSMTLTSPVINSMEKIPSVYTCDGTNIAPELQIGDIPSSTQSLAVIVYDPDAPNGHFVHATVFDAAPTETVWSEGKWPGVLGKNGAGKPGYTGPCPPSGTHRYVFTAYALDTKLGLSSDATEEDVMKAMEGHVLDSAELIGTYARQ